MNPAPSTSPKAAQAQSADLQEAKQDEPVDDLEQPAEGQSSEEIPRAAALDVLDYDDEEAEEKKEVES